MTNLFVLSQCLISLGIIAVIWHWLVAKLRRDNLRSDVRRIRDQLFDLMWKNGYSFEMPEYRETRQMLNGILRLSTTLSPATLLVEGVVAAQRGRISPLLENLNAKSDDPLKIELQRARLEAVKVVANFILNYGIVMRSFVFTLQAVGLAVKAKTWAMSTVEQMLAWAHALGNPKLSQRSYLKLVGRI